MNRRGSASAYHDSALGQKAFDALYRSLEGQSSSGEEMPTAGEKLCSLFGSVASTPPNINRAPDYKTESVIFEIFLPTLSSVPASLTILGLALKEANAVRPIPLSRCSHQIREGSHLAA